MNIFLTDKIYFHFVDENDDDFGCKNDGIGEDGGNYSSDGGNDKDKRGRDREVSPLVVLRVVDLGFFGGGLSGFLALFDFIHRGSVPFQGSPRKEKMIWICFGERILRGRE